MAATTRIRPAIILGLPCGAAAIACLVAVVFADRTAPWWPAPVAWVLSWSLAIWIAWLLDRQGGDHDRAGPGASVTEVVLGIALLAIAVALRVHTLADLPVQLHNDEMSCGLAARKFLAPAPPALFTTGWAWCPNLGYAFTSLPMRLLGATIVGLRASSVVLGLLSLGGLYLFVRTLFERRAALLALALTVPYHWHLHLSRTGFHYIQAATATIWTLAMVAVAFRTRRLTWFAVAGLCLGLGLHTYYATRLVPLIVVAWIAAAAILLPGRRRVLADGLAAVALVALVTCAPIVRFYLEHPRAFTARTSDVLVFGQHAASHVAALVYSTEPRDILAYQVRMVARAPFVGGDTSMQYRYGGPLVPRLLQLPFVAGILIGVGALWRGWRRRRDDPAAVRAALGHAGVWLWVGGTLVVGGILTIDPPFTPRLSGLAMAFMVLPALAFDRLMAWPRRRRLRIGLTLVVVGWVGLAGWHGVRSYFVSYANSAPVSRRDRIVHLLASSGGVRTLVTALEAREELEHQAYRFVAPELRGIQVGAGHAGEVNLDGLARPLLVVLEEDDPTAVALVARYPEAEYHRVWSRSDRPGFGWLLVR